MDTQIEKSLNIVFISGSGRSGTNIVRKILSEHSKIISLPFEYRFTLDPCGLIDFYSTIKNGWSPYLIHKKLRDLKKFLSMLKKRSFVVKTVGKIIKLINPSGKVITPPSYFDWELYKWFPNYERHVCNLLNNLVDFEYLASWPGEKAVKFKNKMYFIQPDIVKVRNALRDFWVALVLDLIHYHKKKIFIEDNTWSILFFKDIKELLPEARFIHVVRDPRDVVASLINQRWAPSELLQTIDYYSSIMEYIFFQTKNADSQGLYTVKLESLIKNPNEEIEKICEFCNIMLEDKMLNVDLSKSHQGRWKLEFGKEEKLILQDKLKYYIKILGYEY